MSPTPLKRCVAVPSLLVVLAASVSACAQMMPGYTPTPRQITNTETPGNFTTKGTYELSADEKALDCAKITGRMQVRILEIRDFETQGRTSDASRAIQSTVVPIFGGTSRGQDSRADYLRDKAKLTAYNAELANKGCSTFNLDEELRPKPLSVTPEPVGPPKKK